MSQPVRYDLFRDYDVANVTDYIYGKFGRWQKLHKAVKTSGSSTTVTENTTGDETFEPVAVGDELYNPANGDRVPVTARASNASVTVGTAVNWAANTCIHYRKFNAGTASTSGAVDTSRMVNKTVHISFDDITATSITVTIEGKVSGGEWSTVYTYPAKTSSDIVATSINPIASVPVTEHFDQMRVGAKVTGDAGAQSFTAFLTGLEE